MKIASWNVNSLRVRLPHTLQWLEARQPDVLGLQETKLQDEDFPVQDLLAAGYHSLFSGQRTYNGVALLSRLAEPPQDVVTDLPGHPDPQRRVLAATYGELRVINLYVPNGQSVGSDKYDYKLGWLANLAEWLADQLKQYPQMVVMGDFNIAPDDRDVHDPQAWEGSVLVSEPERQALARLLQMGFSDTFRQFGQDENTYSWWDYRMNAFRRNRGLRIDLMLASEALSRRCNASHIDREPRAWERPSDHAPVWAQFD